MKFFKNFQKIDIFSSLSKLNLRNFKYHVKTKNLKFLSYLVKVNIKIGSFSFKFCTLVLICVSKCYDLIPFLILQIDPYSF